jgi:uracil-DNA glycosylase
VSAIDYLSEDGNGTYARWHVPDLVPTDSGVELVFVFESPHVDELSTGLPVVGAAGKSALRFLLSDPPQT